MAKTANFDLYVTDSSDDPKFKEWRENLCGSTESNMTKIDIALKELSESDIDGGTFVSE
jgi:hypothetical protein